VEKRGGELGSRRYQPTASREEKRENKGSVIGKKGGKKEDVKEEEGGKGRDTGGGFIGRTRRKREECKGGHPLHRGGVDVSIGKRGKEGQEEIYIG